MTRHPFRKPSRISITVPAHIYHYLVERSNHEGRSISNLASFLLEAALSQDQLDFDKDNENAA